MVIEILVDWRLPSGVATSSVHYYADGSGIANCRGSLNSAMIQWLGLCGEGVGYTVRQTGKNLNTVTGQQTAQWTHATSYTGDTTNTDPVVPDASQALIRWNTSTVINGRFVRGRTFLPGLASAHVVGGNLDSATVTTIGALATMIRTGTNVNHVIWHRPKALAGGVAVPSISGVAWPELAVLRRRRNR